MNFVNGLPNEAFGNKRRLLAKIANLGEKASKLCLVAAMLIAVAAPAHAARIDVRTLSCGQAVNLVRQQGAIVLTLTNRTYDRIVVAQRLCPSHEAGRSVFARTLDAPKCFIGYRCVSGDRLFKGFGN